MRRDAKRDIQPIDLTGANFTGANLASANLRGADLTRADLGRADLGRADLTDADLSKLLWPKGMQVPDGWTVDKGSGWLKRADGLSEVTDHYLR